MMMRRGFLSKVSMMRRGFSTSMFASESDLLRELRGTKEGVKIELNDVLDVLKKKYEWTPQVFTNGEFRNNEDENQASGLLLAWAAKNELSTAQVLRCYGKFARELDPDADDHQNIRQVIKHEMKPGSILFSEPLTKRKVERLDISKDPRMSDVVIHRGTVYLSGQVPNDFESDFATQVTQTLEKVDSLLEKSGSSRSQILSAPCPWPGRSTRRQRRRGSRVRGWWQQDENGSSVGPRRTGSRRQAGHRRRAGKRPSSS